VNRDAIINQSFNFEGTIDVTGYELAIQQKLDFLPYPWNGFGGVFNYTFVDTETSEDVPPIERIAPRSYNLIGYWENDGISIRFTYNWQDVKLINAGGGTANFLGTDRRDQSANGRLDLSASYRLTKQTRLNFRAFNLNNRQEFEFTGGNEDAINRVRFAGRQYQLNVSYNF
jgi:outer membrane receptor protein involved in Fe transport